jgi:hypothetical protein
MLERMEEKSKGIKDRLRDIREFFWPILEPFTDEQIERQKRRLEKYTKENIQSEIQGIKAPKTIDLMLDLAEKLLDDEERRLETVERKAAIIVGFSGVAIMLSFGFIKFLFEKSDISLFNMIIFFLMFIFVNGYFVRALVFSVEALRKAEYHRTKEKDLLDLTGSTSGKKYLISVYIENRVRNSEVINRKVDNMHMGISFFKRALIAVFIIGYIYFLIRVCLLIYSRPYF